MAITKRENGTWRLSIYRIGLPRIRKTFRTREEARKYQKIFEGELEKGNHDVLDTFNKVLKGEISKEEPVANKISFEEYLRGWHSTREKSGGFKINTIRRIEQHLRGYIYPILGSYKLSEINSDKLYTLRDKMYKKGLSKQTVKNCFATIKTSLNDAAKGRRLLPFYPLDDLINIKLNDGDAKKVMPLSYEEQEKLLKIAIDYSNKQNDQRRFMLYYMLVNTGMRYGELCGLKWKDINLDIKTLKIERQCIFPEGNTNPILADLKTDSSKREIELTNDDVKEIKRYKIWASEYLLPMANSPYIQNLDGSHIYKDFGRSTFRTFLKLAELPHFPIHSLRHTHASNLASTSIPIKNISNRLGHSDISTTMNIYAKARSGVDSSYLEEANVRRA